MRENNITEYIQPMTEKIVYILSGPIRSGKTTQLLNWSAGRKDVYGILTPEIAGKKVFMDAQSREQFTMEADPADIAIITIGRYVFLQSAFQKASEIISDSIKNRQPNWLIIDEIGPLELKNDGFANVLKDAINSLNKKLKIILVVREGLIEKVKNQFGINNAIVMTSWLFK